MQTQNSPERKKPKKRRQDSTPPSRSEARALGITKKFIDFVLDHDASFLFRSPELSSEMSLRRVRIQAMPFELTKCGLGRCVACFLIRWTNPTCDFRMA